MIQTWQKKALYEIAAEITSGGAAPQGEPFFENGTFPFVRVADMGKLGMNKYMVDTKDKLNNTGISKLRLFPKGTVLFTKSGASLLLNQRAILNKSMYVVSHIGCIIPSEQVISEWLYYWMLQIDFAKYAHATTLPSLKLTTLKELKVPVPPLEEQARIVARIEELFSQLESGVETLKQTKEQIAVYRQAVLEDAFKGDYSRFSLSDISQAISGYAFKSKLYSPSGEYIVVKIGNVKPFRFDFSRDCTKTNEFDDTILRKYRLIAGDCLITLTGSRGKRDYGYVAMIEHQTNYLLNQRVAALRFNKDVAVPQFYQYYLSSREYRNAFFSYETGNVGQGNVGIKALTETKVILPTISQQKTIITEIESRLSVCDQIEQTVDAALQQAEALRQSILKKAFEGGL